MIDPSLDVWVWLAALAFLVLMAARAWVVETGRERMRGSPHRARTLTVAVGATLALLVGLLTVQGGVLLVTSIVTKTEPVLVQPGQPVDPAAPAAPAAAPHDGDPQPAP